MKRYTYYVPQSVCMSMVLIWLACTCMLPVNANAQQQTINLFEAVSHSVENYPILKQRTAEVAGSKAHVKTIAGNKLPSLMLQEQLDMGTANALQGSYFPLGVVPSSSGSTSVINNNPNTGNLAVSYLQWDFFNFGYYNAQQQAAKAHLAVSEANLDNDKYQLTVNVVSLYIDWLKKYRLLRIEDENLQRAQVILTSIRAAVMSGLKAGVDSSTARSGYADARIAYLQALDNYNYDKIAMQSYTGIVADILPDTLVASSTLGQNLIPVTPADTLSLIHPVLAVYERQYEQQLAENVAISRKYMPHLGFIGAAWARNSGISPSGKYPESLSDGMPYTRYNYLMGISLSYNLFDLKHRSDQLAEGRYAAQSIQSGLQTQQLNLNRLLAQVNIAYETTEEKLKELPVQLSSAQMAYNQQLALYRSGLNTLIEVTNAQYALNKAQINYVNTQGDLLQLQYMNAALTGKSDIFLQKFKR